MDQRREWRRRLQRSRWRCTALAAACCGVCDAIATGVRQQGRARGIRRAAVSDDWRSGRDQRCRCEPVTGSIRWPSNTSTAVLCTGPDSQPTTDCRRSCSTRCRSARRSRRCGSDGGCASSEIASASCSSAFDLSRLPGPTPGSPGEPGPTQTSPAGSEKCVRPIRTDCGPIRPLLARSVVDERQPSFGYAQVCA